MRDDSSLNQVLGLDGARARATCMGVMGTVCYGMARYLCGEEGTYVSRRRACSPYSVFGQTCVPVRSSHTAGLQEHLTDMPSLPPQRYLSARDASWIPNSRHKLSCIHLPSISGCRDDESAGSKHMR